VGELTKEIWIDAAPETVYRYLVEPELIVRWFGEESWNDPREGGVFRAKVRGNVVSGDFVELDPGRRVVHTWGWEGPDQLHAPGTTTVEWDLEPEDGGTRLRLRHSGLTEEGVVKHSEGWDFFVPELAKAAA
jgi:uncharacterized protein YndB with AHSA1/START domain